MGNTISRPHAAGGLSVFAAARAEIAFNRGGLANSDRYLDYAPMLRDLGLPVAHPDGLWLASGSALQKNVRDAIHALEGEPLSMAQIVDMFCTGRPGRKLASLLFLAGCGLIDLKRIEAEAPGMPIISIAHMIAEGGEEAASPGDAIGLYQRFRALHLAGIGLDDADETGLAPIHRTASHKNPAVFDALVDAGADPFATTGPGLNVLHLAAQINGIITAAIKAGVSPESRDDFGRTALHHAAEHRQVEAIRTLLANGARVDAANDEGCTAAHIAASLGDVASLEVLRAAGANLDARSKSRTTPLHWAAMNKAVEAGLLLLSCGADASAVNIQGETPLLLAAGSGSVDFYSEALLAAMQAKLADCKPGTTEYVEHAEAVLMSLINSSDYLGHTALHRAVAGGDLAMVELLASLGADFSCRNTDGETLLHIAARGDDPRLVESLRRFCPADATDDEGNTPLHVAAGEGRFNVITSLAKPARLLEIRNHAGQTPLHLAAQNNQPVALVDLLFLGANIESQDAHLTTPFLTAAKEGHAESLVVLQDNGANIHAIDILGNTALHWAAAIGAESAVSALLSLGLKNDVLNQMDETPALLAMRYGHTYLAAYLESTPR
ncbi:MAG: hypothetical protein RIR70_1819 [Pseudomonadota bacterium]|jgi:ankyrin repeat protein